MLQIFSFSVVMFVVFAPVLLGLYLSGNVHPHDPVVVGTLILLSSPWVLIPGALVIGLIKAVLSDKNRIPKFDL